MAILNKILIQTWQIGSFPRLANGINQTENVLECMLRYDPTLSCKEYFIFSSTVGRSILSTTMMYAIKYERLLMQKYEVAIDQEGALL